MVFGFFFCFLRPAFSHGSLDQPQSLEYYCEERQLGWHLTAWLGQPNRHCYPTQRELIVHLHLLFLLTPNVATCCAALHSVWLKAMSKCLPREGQSSIILTHRVLQGSRKNLQIEMLCSLHHGFWSFNLLNCSVYSSIIIIMEE